MVKLRVDMPNMADSQSVAPGKHLAKLLEAVEDQSKAGNDMIVWKWGIVKGEEEGKEISSYSSLLDNATGSLKRHLKVFGVPEDYEGEVDTRKFVGKLAFLIVKKSKYRDNDGEEREGSSVDSVLPPDSKETVAGSKPSSSSAVKTIGSKKKSSGSAGEELPF